MRQISFKRHRFPPDVIRYAVWLYYRFTMSLRDVEDLLAERGIDVTYETVRCWANKFGPAIAANIRAARQAIGMDLRTMSDALGAAGRKLSPSGISKLENGDRRVDVDDLTVIAYLQSMGGKPSVTMESKVWPLDGAGGPAAEAKK